MYFSSVKAASTLMAATLVAPAVGGSMPTDYKCSGNEPFWGLAIDGEHAGWATPAEPDGRTLKGSFHSLDYAGIFAWRGSMGDGDLVAILTEQSCADSMADLSYPFSVSVSLPDGRILLGCCDTRSRPRTESQPETPQIGTKTEKGDESGKPTREDPDTDIRDSGVADLPIAVLEEKPPGDWSRSLLGLLPALRACIAETPGDSPRVLRAWTTSQGRVGAKTLNGGAQSFECVANRQGTEVTSLTRLAGEAGSLRGDWSPVFTPADQDPPIGHCYQHERVVGADGERIGWLSYDTC